MSDSIWYYARGESEQGPISTAQIKALAAAGALRRDDLVWKEGMENWLPASDVGELFPGNGSSTESGEKQAEQTPQIRTEAVSRPRRQLPVVEEVDLQRLARWVGRGLVVFGVLVVVMSRGCDSLGGRKVARLKAISQAAEDSFQREWDQQKADLETEQAELLQKPSMTAAEQTRSQQLPQMIANLDTEKRKELLELRRGRWRDYRTAADRATVDNQMWGYWRQLAFLFGTMALALGLICVTPTTDGPERWICLVMLVVVLYSVYSSNSVWDASF